jgi:hypothetical protein
MHTRAQNLLKLRELPELPPPPGVWERVLAAHRARAVQRRFRGRAAAAAAVIAASVLGYFVNGTLEEPRPTISVVDPNETLSRGAPSYASLVAESARLERLLTQLPAPPPLVVGSTGGAIVGLEDRIAFVDTQLSYAAAQDLAPLYREALWGERVELMNALVVVRYAQVQGR